ncbi:cytochrome P450 [Hypoxylon argillaceum]|nr:cytochrome P450 [Hypoxylon argillaceum]
MLIHTFSTYLLSPFQLPVYSWTILSVVTLLLGWYISHPTAPEPPILFEIIPFVHNAWQYLTDVNAFMNRAHHALLASGSDVIKFYMGPTKCYMVRGVKNVQTLFNTSPQTLDSHWIQLILMDKHWQLPKNELDKFANDKTGRQETPFQGTEGIPENQRYWFGHNRLYQEWLSKKPQAACLADQFSLFFSQKLNNQPEGWHTVQLFEMLKISMFESATKSLFGTHILLLNPGLAEAYWDFDSSAINLIWGLPRWLRPRPYLIRDRLHEMVKRSVDSAWDNFDPGDNQSDWEEHWGSRLSREVARWFRELGFSNTAIAGHTVGTLFGLHGNTIPITTWALMEIINDPSLLEVIRQEVSEACCFNPETGDLSIDNNKIVALPILQSVYTECMRLHVSYMANRKVLLPTTLDGYHIAPGSLIQTDTEMAHLNEEFWGTENHPAASFWAYRHLKEVEVANSDGSTIKQVQFCMKGRPSDFFPYGGGHLVCPGRHFAKQEIMMAIAVVVSMFDIEPVGWTTMDGIPATGPPKDNREYAGIVAMPPDLDMQIRWKKRYQGVLSTP